MFGWLKRMFATPDAGDDFWYFPIVGKSASGERITPDIALRVSTVYACVRVYADAFASIPCVLFRQSGDMKERATMNPLFRLLHDQPNQWQTAPEFWEMMAGHVVLRGNAYALKVPGMNGPVTSLVPQHPDAVLKVEQRNSDGQLVYTFRQEDGTQRERPQSEVFHLKGLSSDGLMGMSPIALQVDAIGAAKSANTHASKFFSNAARPAGIFKHPGKLKPEAKDNIRTEFKNRYAGSNAHETMVLSEGMDWSAVGMSNEDAQLIETRQYNAVDIARIFRVPPHMIGILDRATFSNIEHQALEFIKYSLLPWVRKFEKAILKDLVAQPQKFFAAFLLQGLERADIKTRYDAHASAIQNEWLSKNEVREIEGFNPVEGGDDMRNPNTKSNTEPQPSQDATEDEPQQNSDDVLSIIIGDVSERIAAAELNRIPRHIKHASDDMEKFVTWVDTFYTNGHRHYIGKTVTPLLNAHRLVSSAYVSEDSLIDALTLSARTSLAANPEATFARWRDYGERQREIECTLTEKLIGGSDGRAISHTDSTGPGRE